MSRRFLKKFLRREKRKMKFAVGDKVKVTAKNRVHTPILELQNTIQEIEAVFGGQSPYRLKGHVFLFREEELELETKATNIVPLITSEVKGATGNPWPAYKSVDLVDYMKLISEVI